LRLDVQLVSPTDCFYKYHREPEEKTRIAEECNCEITEMAKDHPERFMGWGRCHCGPHIKLAATATTVDLFF
jgi:hypothetical protein